MRGLRVAGLLSLLWLAGCQTLPPNGGAIQWFDRSAEKRAAFVQVYALAERELRRQVEGRARGSWGVIMDVDETLLDNSGYMTTHPRYTPPTWDRWTARQAATALPGAVHFTAAVRELGGVVALVTNREEKSCDDTRANLARVGIIHDVILCMGDTSDKNPRFAAVQAGTGGSAPIEVLMWFGDNIGDFPALTQHSADLSAFGTRYFVLPNPIYGSWEE